jgi:hypothetical protein
MRHDPSEPAGDLVSVHAGHPDAPPHDLGPALIGDLSRAEPAGLLWGAGLVAPGVAGPAARSVRGADASRDGGPTGWTVRGTGR